MAVSTVHTVVLFHVQHPPPLPPPNPFTPNPHLFSLAGKGEWSQILERYIVFIFIRHFALNRAIAIKMW